MGSRIRSRSRIRPLLGIVIAAHIWTNVVEWILQKASDLSGAFAFCAGVQPVSSTLVAESVPVIAEVGSGTVFREEDRPFLRGDGKMGRSET